GARLVAPDGPRGAARAREAGRPVRAGARISRGRSGRASAGDGAGRTGPRGGDHGAGAGLRAAPGGQGAGQPARAHAPPVRRQRLRAWMIGAKGRFFTDKASKSLLEQSGVLMGGESIVVTPRKRLAAAVLAAACLLAPAAAFAGVVVSASGPSA